LASAQQGKKPATERKKAKPKYLINFSFNINEVKGANQCAANKFINESF
jgi:hypothetical protein